MNCRFCHQELIKLGEITNCCIHCQMVTYSENNEFALCTIISSQLYQVSSYEDFWQLIKAPPFIERLSQEDFKNLFMMGRGNWSYKGLLPWSFVNNLTPQNINQKLLTYLTFR